MKIAKTKVALLQTVLMASLAGSAIAQATVTVPPATMPATADATAASVPVAMDPAPAAAASAPTAMPAEPTLPATTTTTTTTTVAAPAVQPAMPSPATAVVPVSTTAVTTPPAGMPSGTPAVVTQVMSNLQDAQSNVSVEDLSKAQDALTRLDLLLQIEKKIGEIKKTQDDRESGGSGGMAGQIPASALVLPGQGMPGQAVPTQGMAGQAMPMASAMPTPTPKTVSDYEIEQISGTNGAYNAILTTADGDRKTLRVGDKLDGRTVRSISLDGVELSAASGKKGSKKGGKTLSIHNDTVLLMPMAR